MMGQRRWKRSDVVLLAASTLSLLILMMAPLGHRWGWWSYRVSFQIIRYDAYAALAGLFLTLIIIPIRILKQARFYFAPVLAAVLFGIAFGIPRYWLSVARSVPPIHDITTDPENPPQFVEILKLRGTTSNPVQYEGKKVAEQQKAAYPDIRPLELSLPPQQVFHEALEAARAMGWAIVAVDVDDGRIEATDTSFWFGFKDDVVIRIRPKGGGTRVDVRSVSRVGRSDLGANARRIRRYLDLLKRRIRTISTKT